MTHFYSLIYFGIAFISALFFIPIAIRFARKKGWADGNDERKIHQEKVSSLGGVPLFLATLIGLVIYVGNGSATLFLIMGLALPLMIIGVLDDLFQMSISFRIISQVLLGVFAYELGFCPFESGYWLLDMSVTTFISLLLINAYNFIDGINGLAGSLGLVASLFFGAVLLSLGHPGLSVLCFAYAGGLSGFLFFNFRKKAKIFMGDCGSTVMGFLMALMFMAVCSEGVARGEAHLYWPYAIALVSIPVIDLAKVTLFRVGRGQSPLAPDRSHVHHLFVDKGTGHRTASVLLAGWTLAFGLVAYAFPSFFNFLNAMFFLAVPYLLAECLFYLKKQKASRKEKVPVNAGEKFTLT